MARRMNGNVHVRCRTGEKVEITSKPYLLLYIYGGNDFENGTVSYSEKICDEFYEQLCNSVSPENIAINFYSNLYNDDMINIIENGTLKQNKSK